MSARQDSDDLAWDRSDELFEEAMKHVRLTSTCRKVEAFAQKIYGEKATLVTPLVIGGFNVLYPIDVQVKGSAQQFLIRLPCPDQALFPEEKTLAEAATAIYIDSFTRLPVSKAFHHGVDPDIGPYMIIQDLVTRRSMSRALELPRDNLDDTPVLNPHISEAKLTDLYKKMARCTLQLAQPSFSRIGALVEKEPGISQISGRPITLNMSNMVQLANIPTSVFPPEGTTYQTADACPIHQLRATLPAPDGSNSFRLWSDDFRPVNVLIDDNDDILGVIDWEFTYAAPTQFTLDCPWWLLLDVPEIWDDGIQDWINIYEEGLKIWLKSIEEVEAELEPGSFLLSAHMRESWEMGRFWLNYAARKSWAFDFIYWKYLDEEFFGEREEKFPDDIPMESLWKTRVHLLTDEEAEAMESLVQIKMEESKQRILVEWDATEATQRMSCFLFD